MACISRATGYRAGMTSLLNRRADRRFKESEKFSSAEAIKIHLFNREVSVSRAFSLASNNTNFI